MRLTLIPAMLAALTFALTFAWPARAYDGEQYVVCNLNPQGDNFLALRSCPSTKCDLRTKLAPGTFLLTVEPTGQNGWREVIVQDSIQDFDYQGPKGWVHAGYICQIVYP